MDDPSKTLFDKFQRAGWQSAGAAVEKIDGTGGSASFRFCKEASEKVVTLGRILAELDCSGDTPLTDAELIRLRLLALKSFHALAKQGEGPERLRW